jgi:tRNA(Ile)-lysidine synthase
LPTALPLEDRFDAAWPALSWRDLHVVLAVSAGPDSVAMLRAAMALKNEAGGSGKLFVAHLNHALRGDQADADEAWLKALCQRLNVPLELGKADVAEIAAQQGDGLEAAARAARYDFLQSSAERLGARFVATAHTADDQVETVLHRIVRGTGLSGLAGMVRSRPLSPSVTLVRPLLDMRRRDVLDYLAAIGQDYRTDPSNADPRFTRNRLRHDLLPLLREQYNADVDAALLRLATQACDSQQLVAELAAGLVRKCVARNAGADGVRIDCQPLCGQSPLVIREVFKIAWNDAGWPQQAMGFDQWQQLAELVRTGANSPTVNLPGNIRARRDKHHLILERLGLA